jgi:hypothetical protein
MTCAPTDRLLQTLRTRVAGATDDMLKLDLFNTMDEFFRRTSAWKYEIAIELKEDTYEYDLETPASATFVRVMSASHNGIPVPNTQSGVVQSSVGVLVPELTFPDGDALFQEFSSDEAPDGTFTWALYRPSYISFTGVPGADGRKYPFIMVIALSLAKGCLEEDCDNWEIPDWMYDMYFDAFLDGALGRLYSMPAKPWTNPQMALFHGRKFRSAMGYRKQEIRRGFAYNIQTWRFPRGGW